MYCIVAEWSSDPNKPGEPKKQVRRVGAKPPVDRNKISNLFNNFESEKVSNNSFYITVIRVIHANIGFVKLVNCEGDYRD